MNQSKHKVICIGIHEYIKSGSTCTSLSHRCIFEETWTITKLSRPCLSVRSEVGLKQYELQFLCWFFFLRKGYFLLKWQNISWLKSFCKPCCTHSTQNWYIDVSYEYTGGWVSIWLNSKFLYRWAIKTYSINSNLVPARCVLTELCFLNFEKKNSHFPFSNFWRDAYIKVIEISYTGNCKQNTGRVWI